MPSARPPDTAMVGMKDVDTEFDTILGTSPQFFNLREYRK